MDIHKKKIGEINLLSIIVVTSILLILVIIGSFLDLEISTNLSNQDSLFGKIFESFGQVLGFCMGSVGGAMICAPLFKSQNKKNKIFGAIIALVCFFGFPYFIKGSISGKSGYSWYIGNTLGYFIAVIISTISYFASYYLIDKDVDKKILIKNGLIIILTLVVSVVLINYFLKFLAYRPRYRAMAWDNALLNTKAIGTSYYQNWWNFSFFKTPQWASTLDIPKDYIKSWPSGHTSCAACVLTIPFFTSVIKKPTKLKTNICFYVGVVYTFIVAFARIIIGAHFLSDVAWGYLVTIIVLVIVILLMTNNKKKSEKIESN